MEVKLWVTSWLTIRLHLQSRRRSVSAIRRPKRASERGNPAGRPKGGSTGLLSEEASRPIKVCIYGQDITLPAEQAAIRALAASAAHGQLRAQAIFLKLISAAEQDEAADEHVLDEARE